MTAVGERVYTLPFTVIVDSRENLPYTFDAMPRDVSDGGGLWAVPLARAALPFGDYSIVGHTHMVIERKSKADLWGTISRRRRQFEAVLLGLNNHHRWPRVVVECEHSDAMANPPPHTRFTAQSINRAILAWQCRYPRIQWHWYRDREVAERMTFLMLMRAWKERENVCAFHDPTWRDDLDGLEWEGEGSDA